MCESVCVPCAILCSYGEEGYGLMWYLYIKSPSRRLMTVIMLALAGFLGFLFAAMMNAVTLLHILVYIPVIVSCVTSGVAIPWHAFIRPDDDTDLKALHWDAYVGFGVGVAIAAAIGGVVVPVLRLGANPDAFYPVLASHIMMTLSIAVSIAPQMYDEDGPIGTT